MEFELTQEQKAFRQEVRDFLAKEITDQVIARAKRGSVGPYSSPEIKRKFIEKGWFVVHWPKEMGGQGWGPVELTLFFEEMGYVRVSSGGLHNIAENIRLFGTEEQKQFFLPRFSRGELDFTLGLSEPNAGVDAANVQIRAELKGDDFLINGAKMWGGSGDPGYARNNWHWLVCRTDPNLPRHRGLSIIMVPLDSPGITIRPVRVMGSVEHLEDTPVNTVAAIYYDNVRVPRSHLLGELNRGWYQLMTGLDSLRTMIGAGYLGEARHDFQDLVEYVRGLRGSGRFAGDSQVVRHRLVELRAEIETLRHLSYHIAALEESQTEGLTPATHLASMTKVWSAELLQRLSSFGVHALGCYGVLCRSEATRHLKFRDEMQRLSRWSRQLSIGGGSSEVLRTQIAQRYLGLPR